MIKETLHDHFLNSSERICEWFQQKSKNAVYPIYSSYDIRDSGYKITTVDANIYPAGFNNICPQDKETAPDLIKKYLQRHYDGSIQRILLVPEEHTQNAYYWENVGAISDLLKDAGINVQIGFARKMEKNIQVQSATGRSFEIASAMPGTELMEKFKPQLILSNNDFSDPHEEWSPGSIPVNPPRELGWYQRKKSRFFKYYNQLINEFCQIANIDPFVLNVQTEEFSEFDLAEGANQQKLADRIDMFLEELRISYRKHNLQQEPFVFVKNNSGTYGLAVVKVTSGKEILDWTYRSRKKMKAAKGGRDVEQVIIQEGIPSSMKTEGATAEPVVYMIGCELAGGFLRTHVEKGDSDNLNSPGAVYKRMCVADLGIKPSACPRENVYGWIAKIAMLAIAEETKEMGVSYESYRKASC